MAKSVGQDRRRVLVAAATLVLLAVLCLPTAAWPQGLRLGTVLFTQQDEVQAFDFVTGLGYQTGTVTGRISGTSFVDFQFSPSGPPVGDLLPFTFKSKVVITDLDGDQITFENEGSGKFHLGVGTAFIGQGGPLRGTYVVTGGTGKFKSWKVGTTFQYRAIATNPPPTGRLGTVYVEISEREN